MKLQDTSIRLERYCKMTKKEQAEILGIKIHNRVKRKEENDYYCCYKLLSIEEWTKEICEAINTSDYTTKFYFNSDDEKRKLEQVENEDIHKIFANLTVKPKIYFWNELPVDFVRFSGYVILKEQNLQSILMFLLKMCIFIGYWKKRKQTT